LQRRYDFEYEDDDDEQSGDVDIENKYYNAKQLKVDDPESAIDEFLGIPALEEEKSDWYGSCRMVSFQLQALMNA
jgi:COP9 signalosome complex subunit 2